MVGGRKPWMPALIALCSTVQLCANIPSFRLRKKNVLILAPQASRSPVQSRSSSSTTSSSGSQSSLTEVRQGVARLLPVWEGADVCLCQSHPGSSLRGSQISPLSNSPAESLFSVTDILITSSLIFHLKKATGDHKHTKTSVNPFLPPELRLLTFQAAWSTRFSRSELFPRFC